MLATKSAAMKTTNLYKDMLTNLIKTLAPVFQEILTRPSDSIHAPDWNPLAHVEITLSIAECRAIVAMYKDAKTLLINKDNHT